jgi:hypothetical protein
MQTRQLMTASAAAMGVAGLALQFAPQEVLAAAGVAATAGMAVAAQVTGALYLGFAILNWMSKGARIGGIYGRPLAMANLVHLVTGGLALLRYAAGRPSLLVWSVTLLYAGFAAAFAFVAFTHPRDL